MGHTGCLRATKHLCKYWPTYPNKSALNECIGDYVLTEMKCVRLRCVSSLSSQGRDLGRYLSRFARGNWHQERPSFAQHIVQPGSGDLRREDCGHH